MPTQDHLSLLPDVNRRPFFPSVTSRGNHATTCFYAPFAQLGGGNLARSSFLQLAANPVPILVFLQDRPAALWADSSYVGAPLIDDSAGDTYTLTAPNFFESAHLYSNPANHAFPSLITGVTPAAPLMGAQVRGDTFTNGVEVSGYMCEIPVGDRSIQGVGPADLIVNLRLMAFAEGLLEGNPSNGAILSYDGAGTAFANHATVLLRESDYTAAMADAGNVFTAANGTVVHVVGIFFIPGAPVA